MASYREIQAYIMQQYGFVAQTCWIAHMKEVCGLPVHSAPNRADQRQRVKPCPDEKQDAIREAFLHFHML